VNVLARVEVAEFPGGTLEDWIAWRERETARMFAELQAQLDAWFTMHYRAPTVH
jgi:hypothetical protein